jgi:hypothetical protein
MFESLLSKNPGLPSSSVLMFDVARGDIHKGARLGARIAKDIDAACMNIAAIWPTITK